MAADTEIADKCENTFKCHSNMKVPKIVICIVCESVYHEGDFNRYKKGYFVGKRLVVCPEHCEDNITSLDHAVLDENARKIIAQIKQHEKEDLKTCLSSSVMLNMSNQNDILNKTVIHDEEDKLVSAKVEIELLRELNQELKSKNLLLTELLEHNKAEITKSYADTLKINNNEKLADNIPNIVIKAKSRESAESCEQTVKRNISANTSAQIRNVMTTKTGAVIVKCKNKEDVTRTKSMLSEKLGENYEVNQDKMNLPKIKIFDIDSDMDKDELIEDICNRNSVMFDGNFNIVADFTSGNKKRSLILEVSSNIYLSVMSAGVLYVGHKCCRVYDTFDLSICYKCGRANHSQKKCNNEAVCLICAGRHDTKACTSCTKKCANCVYYNKQFNKNHCTDHVATDISACEYLKSKLNKLLKSTEYPIQPRLPTHLGKVLEPKRSAT